MSPIGAYACKYARVFVEVQRVKHHVRPALPYDVGKILLLGRAIAVNERKDFVHVARNREIDHSLVFVGEYVGFERVRKVVGG
ncbi:hypothetical protein CAPN008_06060 [Capnocytophaga canis]|nr:hypothetical protein CAPN008_06060 [Capnocytophaga canis]